MKNILSIFITCVATNFLSACGGGLAEDGYIYTPPSYGSIAINPVTGSAGIAANYSSQNAANSAAIIQCGLINCETVLEFGSKMCGALSRGSNVSIFGWASNSSSYDAKVSSTAQCVNRNGVGCAVILDMCNSS